MKTFKTIAMILLCLLFTGGLGFLFVGQAFLNDKINKIDDAVFQYMKDDFNSKVGKKA